MREELKNTLKKKELSCLCHSTLEVYSLRVAVPELAGRRWPCVSEEIQDFWAVLRLLKASEIFQ